MQQIVETIWREKYRHGDEASPAESKARVAAAVCAGDLQGGFEEDVLAAMLANEWCPGGRIHASAGTDLRNTLLNCFVNGTIDDSMPGIMAANTRAALTMQTGGGIGQDFSTLRPKGAVVKGVGSVSSGPLSFMDVWDATCATIMSGGNRRGAMIATLADDHPDIFDFVTAKRERGKLTNFNLSVLVSDALMKAVKVGGEWELGFGVPPANVAAVLARERDGKPWYVYRRLPARELWEAITRSSYDWAEPGVIFIDRVNEWNNLGYCEDIRATNPCGEQPLPPNGACNLGCVNLAVMVREPFTSSAYIDFKRLEQVVRLGVSFLDNVLDLTNYPVPAQAEEASAKRRIGLGIMGLGNMLQAMGLRYGSDRAVQATGAIMRAIRDFAYSASVDLARERGSFPLFDRERFLERPFVRALPERLRNGIAEHGIRNGVLLTIAPTGTTAIYYGNVSSGLEPTFAWRYTRKVLQPDGSQREFAVTDAGWDAYCHHNGLDPETAPTTRLPDYMATATELTVEDHVRMQAACQQYVDASISKTINCPPDITYDDFKDVYQTAYDSGCKGATTYRPSGVRGSVLSVEPAVVAPPLPKRPEVLHGTTYKLKWPATDDSFYVTINDTINGGARRPFEIFVASRSTAHAEMLSGLTLLMSAILRRAEHPLFMVEDLERVQSTQGAWVKGKYVPGVVALIAGVLRRHMGLADEAVSPAPVEPPIGEPCPKCGAPALIRSDGCKKCLSCSYSECN